MHFVPLDLGLVSSDDGKQLVGLQKIARGFGSVEVRAASDVVEFVFIIAFSVIVVNRIGPEEIAILLMRVGIPEKALFRRFLEPIDHIDVLNHLEVRGDTSVDCQKPAVDDTAEREEVEGLHEHVVDLLVVLVKALVPEIEETGHLPTLVISSNKVDGLREVDFEGVKQYEDLDRKAPSVDKVSQKEVLGPVRIPAYVQYLNQIVILPMDIANNGQRVSNIDQVSFRFYNKISLENYQILRILFVISISLIRSFLSILPSL